MGRVWRWLPHGPVHTMDHLAVDIGEGKRPRPPGLQGRRFSGQPVRMQRLPTGHPGAHRPQDGLAQAGVQRMDVAHHHTVPGRRPGGHARVGLFPAPRLGAAGPQLQLQRPVGHDGQHARNVLPAFKAQHTGVIGHGARQVGCAQNPAHGRTVPVARP
ncbi:hypothetical protein D9M68_792280 [compost metagenome]